MSSEQQAVETAKHVGDAASVVVGIAALATWLPPVAALLTIIWTAIRIYETRTVQRWLHGKKNN